MYSTITKDIKTAVAFLDQGRIVAFPTGTSYGLAADTQQGHALQRLRNLKGRPQDKALTVFMAEKLWPKFIDLTAPEKNLLSKTKNQPLTLLVRPKKPLEHLSRNGLVGLRVIDHPLMKKLGEAVNVPLTATSANLSGEEPCLSPSCVQKHFPGKLDPSSKYYGDIAPAGDTTYDLSLACVLDAGELPPSQPSTIAAIEFGEIKIIRPGGISEDKLRNL